MKRILLMLAALAALCACGPGARTPGAYNLDEEVNVGYGTTARKDLTASVDKHTVNTDVVAAYSSIAEYLRGRVAGVEVNANGTIQIRGAQNLQGPSAALVLVDGAECSNINALNPNDIKSIEVLKDGGSTAIYGSRGGNGVVLITTKGGFERQQAAAEAAKAERQAKLEARKAEKEARKAAKKAKE